MCQMESMCDEDFDRLLANVGIANSPDCWRDGWLESQSLTPDILRVELIDQVHGLVPLSSELVSLVKGTMLAVQADASLTRLTCLWHHLVFTRDVAGASSWPLPPVLPDNLRALFPVVVLVTGLPRMLEIHRRLGIPETITSQCLLNLPLWAEHYRKAHGRYGFAELSWLQNSFQGRLFRLGRLEFMHSRHTQGFRVYRSRLTGEVVALAGDGTRFRRDGLVDGTNGITDTDAWTATLHEADGAVVGYPISSDGFATTEPIELSPDEWNQLLGPKTGVLDVHIPMGDKMDYDACITSFRAANEFFPAHFPDNEFTGFACSSWLLDPELEHILPPESNIVRFLHEFYLIPILSDDSQTFTRVFGSKPDDLSKAPRDTSLQRGILDHIAAGNQMRRGFGFIPADEIGREHRYYRAAAITG